MSVNHKMVWWIIITIGSSPAWGALFWVLWQGQVRPRLIPARQIEMQAAQMITRYGADALEMAASEEDRSWRYSHPFEQGRWKRVGLSIKNLLK